MSIGIAYFHVLIVPPCLANFVFGRSFAPLGVFRKQRRVAYFEAPDCLSV
jgi:hypothetical protein